MRHKKAQKRTIGTDSLYNSLVVGKIINRIMRDGKKSVAQKVIYDTLDAIKEKGHDPLQALEKALDNIGPRVELKARRVGGANYQVPIEVRVDRKQTLAIRWLIEAARARSSKDYHTFDLKLTAEILDALEEKGSAITKRNNTLKQAEANKAFAHFRW